MLALRQTHVPQQLRRATRRLWQRAASQPLHRHPRRPCQQQQQQHLLHVSAAAASNQSNQRMGEFLAGNDLSRPATLARRVAVGLLVGCMATGVTWAIVGVDDVLAHFGVTRPSVALKAKTLNALDESAAAEAALGTPIRPDTTASVGRQALVRVLENGMSEDSAAAAGKEQQYLQRIKFGAVGPKGRADVFAEGDIDGNPNFIALQVSPHSDGITATGAGPGDGVGGGGAGEEGSLSAVSRVVVVLGEPRRVEHVS